jgi:Leucine-rich repeat (LRR) protein
VAPSSTAEMMALFGLLWGLLLFLTFSGTVVSECEGSISLQSYDVLQILYNSTAGWNWTWSTTDALSSIWHFPSNLSAPCSDHWQGLLCSRSNLTDITECEIQLIDLLGRNLKGIIPSELGSLASLKTLNLESNSLEGTIPPQIGNLTDLTVLYLNNNLLEGSIPTELGQLRFLTHLEMEYNYFTGTIPSELSNVEFLVYLYLFDSFLTGAIPSQLGDISLLHYLYLDNNLLEGAVPSQLSKLTLLEVINLSYNFLDSSLPSDLGNLANMHAMEWNNNLLGGVIPSELSKISFLQGVFLDFNLLEGTVPSALGALTSLWGLFLNNNLLQGSIPTELSSSAILILALNNNLFDGPLDFFVNLTNIQYLDCSSNSLSGTLTANARWPLLSSLNFSSNRLSGSVNFLLGAPSLEIVDLSNNYFVGTLPENAFTQLQSLQTIVLSQNCFMGSLPTTICEVQNLTYAVLDTLTGNCGRAFIFLPGNILRQNMDGSIPSCLWNSSRLRVLHLYGNGLEGSLVDITNASALSILGLGSNELTGSIPKSFQLHNFTQLDLSINRLSGTLEADLVVDPTSTTVYDLSANRLSGNVPISFYASFDAGVLNVLSGNIFGCQQSNIPSSDASHSSYQCGSFAFEYSFILWLCFVGMLTCFCATSASLLGVDWLGDIPAARRSMLREMLVGPVTLTTVAIVGLVGFIIVKIDSNLGVFMSTHAVQYWWTASTVFVHSWGIFGFIFLLLSVQCVLFTLAMISLQRSHQLHATEINSHSVGGSAAVSSTRQVCAHAINISVVLFVNALYILLAVDNIGGVALLALQASLAGFKLVWSTACIPWLLSWSITTTYKRTSHRLFMVLFVFLGAPFVSAFCGSNACFYYMLTSPQSVSTSFEVGTGITGPACDSSGCSKHTEIMDSTLYVMIVAPWMYSYQCSSAVIENYAPVLVLSFIVSGIIAPCSLYVASNYISRRPSNENVLKTVVSCFAFELTYESSSSAVELINSDTASMLGARMLIKYILNMAVMLTFGLAVPLLALAVLVDTTLNLFTTVTLLERFVRLSKCNNLDAEVVVDKYWLHLGIESRYLVICSAVVLVYVSVFWSLFAFDWIADVYGSRAGAVAMLVPVVMPTLLGAFVLRGSNYCAVRSAPRLLPDNIELHTLHSPMILPQSTQDRFRVVDSNKIYS